jgi:adenylate cyclase
MNIREIKMIKLFKLNLYIPLYLLIIITFLLGSLISSFIEIYSKVDFETFMKYVGESRNVINVQLHEVNGEVDDISLHINENHEIWDEVEEYSLPDYKSKIAEKYPMFKWMKLESYFILFIVYWLFPIYRQNYTGNQNNNALVQKRIIQLPLVILILPWVMGAYKLFFEIFFSYKYFGFMNGKLISIYILSYLIFCTLVNYLNLGATNRYISNKIAFSNFKKPELYTLKKGYSITLGLRISLLILALAIIPLIINLYIPVFFNYWQLKSLFTDKNPDFIKITQLLIPLLAMSLITIFYSIAQIFAISSLKKSIVRPMNQLIHRMNDVAKGDFTSRSSVLTADEIGQMKGHFNSMVEGLEDREKIRDTFGKFVSMEIAEKIMNTGSIQLTGEEIETTVMFTDIRDFTPLSESLSPMELIDLLNTYFSYMVKPIQEEKGVINKFLGDSIMAVFSPVFGVENHAEAAVRASLKLRDSLKDFNALKKFQPIRHGVGIHTGILIAGNIGSEERKEYTVIGDTVNIASRIESQTKVFDTDILLSDNLLNKLNKGDFPQHNFIPFEPVKMKGKSYSMLLYKIESEQIK